MRGVTAKCLFRYFIVIICGNRLCVHYYLIFSLHTSLALVYSLLNTDQICSAHIIDDAKCPSRASILFSDLCRILKVLSWLKENGLSRHTFAKINARN